MCKNWKDKARVDYETGDFTLKEIAEKYNKTHNYLRILAMREKWLSKKKQSTDIQQIVNSKKQEIIQQKTSEIEKLVNDEIALRQRVLKEMSCIAFSDVRKLFNDDYTLKNISDLADEDAAAISSVEFTSTSLKNDDAELTKKVKLWDKQKTLESLAKYLGLFEKDNNQKSDKQMDINLIAGDKQALIDIAKDLKESLKSEF